MKYIEHERQLLEAGKKPVGCEPFQFACHHGVSCFTRCCKNVNMDLHPYDVIRIKNRLGIRSDEFLERYANTETKDNDLLPSVRLKLLDNEEKTCPFLTAQACSIYEDRPDACRTYPLERAVLIVPFRPSLKQEFYFLTPQPICQGHYENKQWTVRQWLEDQNIKPFNQMNDLWAEIEALFHSFQSSINGLEDPKITMAFMASYNIDKFRDFIFQSAFLTRYRVDETMREKIKSDDEALYKFGLDWIKFFLCKIKPVFFEPA
jgi:hypothetical protein